MEIIQKWFGKVSSKIKLIFFQRRKKFSSSILQLCVNRRICLKENGFGISPLEKSSLSQFQVDNLTSQKF